jgi:class 3 adenylate cyclase
MTAIGDWLQRLGLGEHAETFERERIDIDAVPHLTDANLKDLGLPMGHRVKLLAALRSFARNPFASSPRAAPVLSALTEPAATGAERRQLTVLFCDLVGSSQLSQRLDPEQYREVVRTYQAACGEVIAGFDGHTAQFLGDGLLVYFGYPKAHEDDAQRAVRVGLGIIEAVSTLSMSDATLSIRVGIHTGVVVVGEVGVGSSRKDLALGKTPNLAARLQALASPNTIALSSRTRELTAGSFEYRDLGARALKGFAEPIRVWQPLAESKAESRFEAATRGLLAPMVGRDLEFAVLMRASQRVRSGKRT